ncbi:MAG: 30S ribosomal protein S4 [Nanoarchaeota archaeon]|nr:30S ribosomal protein S4 [Nanoarchaeota archaeon]
MFGKKNSQIKRPKKLFDKTRIDEENDLRDKYGLKNKKEIWKAEFEISIFRRRAKSLITAGLEEQKIFLDKLNKIGFSVDKIADVLALNKEDWLKRRLQTMILKNKVVNTPKEARQLIVHKHIKVNENVVNIPSYMVKKDEEDKITVDKVMKTVEMKDLEKKEKPVEKDSEGVKVENKAEEISEKAVVEEIKEAPKEEVKVEEVKE